MLNMYFGININETQLPLSHIRKYIYCCEFAPAGVRIGPCNSNRNRVAHRTDNSVVTFRS